MRVGVIGGGAVGLFLSAYLCKAGLHTTVYTRGSRQAEDLNNNGITLITNNIKETIAVHAKTLSSNEFNEEIFLITVKQYDLLQVIETLIKRVNPSILLFFQNGLAHIDILKELDVENIGVAAFEHGVLRISPTIVEHTGKGKIKVGTYKGLHSKIWPTLDGLNGFQLGVEAISYWYEALAKKMLVNAVINPLSALLRVKNGELLTNKHYFYLMEKLFLEAYDVLQLPQSKHGLWEYVVSVCSKTSNNYSSMLIDLKNNRQTEIDAISGYLLKLQRNKNQHLPFTSFVYESIKGMESRKEA